MSNFGYRLSDPFVSMAMQKYDLKRQGHIKFDDFIRLNFVLQTYTAAFRKADTDQDGWVQLSYEQFLTLVMEVQ